MKAQPGKIVALGLAPHSGWAAAVVLGGTAAAPRVLARSRLEMMDPDDPESRFPYHTAEKVGVEEGARRIAAFEAAANTRALAGLRALTEDLAGHGWVLGALGILDASGRKPGALAAILASHAAIHAAEGEHFRSALATAAERQGLAVTRVRARDLEGAAAVRLRRPAPELRESVLALGREVGPPWGADQKAAALLAWLLPRARLNALVRP